MPMPVGYPAAQGGYPHSAPGYQQPQGYPQAQGYPQPNQGYPQPNSAQGYPQPNSAQYPQPSAQQSYPPSAPTRVSTIQSRISTAKPRVSKPWIFKSARGQDIISSPISMKDIPQMVKHNKVFMWELVLQPCQHSPGM
ncbi:hypothetical protein EVAR_26746_1 [Eumeta japonica]|uniref:Uncharacterized protein n=1 Tax=Eumeta variegata TaxID=151549 RepID=A0A4C2A8C7_EUMVA|nr:hypothetical protein EVAR_26746_1 [Eumeta japonica]